MSTKNLARTVIEGGRTSGYKVDTRERKRAERASSREYLHLVTHDSENAESVPAPKRLRVRKEFADKLSPLWGFLDSRVGQNWSKVRSEMFQRFDTRSTPGRHVLFDHALKEINDTGDPVNDNIYFRYRRYVIDSQGRLQKSKHRTSYKSYYEKFETVDWKVVAKWLGVRGIRRCGNRFAWVEPINPPSHVIAHFDQGVGWRASYTHAALMYVAIDRSGSIILDDVPVDAFRHDYRYGHTVTTRFVRYEKRMRTVYLQWKYGKILNTEDERYFCNLPKRAQKTILKETTS